MDRPDTMIEVHREVVEQQAAGIYAGDHYDQDVDGTGFTAQASVTLELDHVWFIFETVDSLSSGNANLRPWQEEIGGVAQDPLRHFAFGLNVGTGSVITIESVACIPLVPLPPKTVTIPDGPRAGESQQIPFNEIPLYGRLTIHDHLEVRTVEPGKQTISLNLNPQDAPLLVAAPPADVLDSRLFGPDVERRADGSTAFGGQDPRITWDIDYAEAHWITHSTVGELLVNFERLQHPGMSDADARTAVLDLIAGELAGAIRAKVPDIATPDPNSPTPPPVGVLDLVKDPLAVDPDSDDDSTTKEVDAIVQRFGAATDPQESMVVQLRTLRELPTGEELPASVLAENSNEKTALATTGFGVLLGVRTTVMKSFTLDAADFDPSEPCLLDGPKTIKINGEDTTLNAFAANIVTGSGADPGKLVLTGKITQNTTLYDFDSTFTVTYLMELDDLPRDVLSDEPGQWGDETIAELNADISTADAGRAAGTLNSTDYELEMKRIHDAMAELPRTVGVQPTLRPPEPDVDPHFSLTALGALALLGVVLAALILPAAATIAGVGLSAALGPLIILATVDYIGLLFTVNWIGDAFGTAKVQDALDDRRDGTVLPSLGIPVDTSLTRQRLAVFFRQLPQELDVSCVKPDTADDADQMIQLVGGAWPTDGKQWRISDSDAALSVNSGALTLFVSPDVTGGTRQPIGVSTSTKGRLFLRADRNTGTVDNLGELPRCELTP
jgi:hypothetical protein